MNEQGEAQALPGGMIELGSPWVEQMQAEFDQIEQDLQNEGIDEDDQRLIWGYTRSLSRRQDEIDRTKAYCDRTVNRLQNEMASIKSWKGHLVEEAVARGIQGQRKKSLDTPGGRVGFRTRAAASLIVNPLNRAGLMEWAKETVPGAVTENPPTFSLAKTPIVEYIKAGGKCPHATINPPGEDFYYYKPPKQEKNDGQG